MDKVSDPGLSAYSETGIWFSRFGNEFFQRLLVAQILSFSSERKKIIHQLFRDMMLGGAHWDSSSTYGFFSDSRPCWRGIRHP